MVDAVIELGRQDIGTQTTRTIRVGKARGMAPLLGQHLLRINEQGLHVIPRIESLPAPPGTGVSEERVPWGLPELDEMMEGGPRAGTTTLLAGALGTGKTVACIHYIVEGARRGEKGLLVASRESPQAIIDQSRILGLDLAGAIDAGMARILHRPPTDLVVEEATWEMLEAVDQFAPRRLALDSIDDVIAAIDPRGRATGFLSALTGILRSKGVTSLMMKEVSQLVGPSLDFSDTPLALLAENLVLFRYVEFRGDLYRIVAIIKMRHAAHDHSIRQYTIGAGGIKVLQRLESAEGVLTGIARFSIEARARRGGSR